MRRSDWLFLILPALATACGGGSSTMAPIEDGDEAIASIETGANRPPGLIPGGPDLDGTVWRWVEAHCTEGPLDLSGRGFSEELRVRAVDDGLVLVRDRVTADNGCEATVMTYAKPPAEEGSFEWRVSEAYRVAMPPTEACLEADRDPPRPGEVRKNGEFLEVLVQRSQWCDGFEVRHVYAPLLADELEGPQVVRHYVGHFNLRNADAIADLFAPVGAVVEPFTQTEIGTFRHCKEPEGGAPVGGAACPTGLANLKAWYEETLGSVEWLALDLQSVEALGEAGAYEAAWRYMDDRLEQPFEGKNTFRVVGGEIVQTEILVDAEPQAKPVEEPPEGEAEGADEAGDGADAAPAAEADAAVEAGDEADAEGGDDETTDAAPAAGGDEAAADDGAAQADDGASGG